MIVYTIQFLTLVISLSVLDSKDPVDSLSDREMPLFLTKYIESKIIEEGRRASEVIPFLDGIKSYSGLLTVDKKKLSHMFFWYFPAEERPESSPLVIWLSGYSTPSTKPIFLQTGPYRFEKGELKRMEVTWQKFYHMVYFDNPIGVGFSFTETPDGYSKDIANIGVNLKEALDQFLILFPELSKQEIYLCGTSTAGKYLPTLAHSIFMNNQNLGTKLNLKGLFLSNPYLDPSQIDYSEYLYEHGFISKNEKCGLIEREANIRRLLQNRDYEGFYNAVKSYSSPQVSSYLLNITGLKTTYDYSNKVLNLTDYQEFIEKSEVRKELHVGNTSYDKGSKAMDHFAQPYAFSVKPLLEDMINDVEMLFLNGQLDIAWAYPMMTNFLSTLDWHGAEGYRSATRTKLYHNSELAGYVRNYKSLTDILVFNVAHGVINENPELVLQLFHNFTGHYSNKVIF